MMRRDVRRVVSLLSWLTVGWLLLRLFNAVSLHRFLTDCVHNAERLWDALRDLLMLAAGLFL